MAAMRAAVPNSTRHSSDRSGERPARCRGCSRETPIHTNWNRSPRSLQDGSAGERPVEKRFRRSRETALPGQISACIGRAGGFACRESLQNAWPGIGDQPEKLTAILAENWRQYTRTWKIDRAEATRRRGHRAPRPTDAAARAIWYSLMTGARIGVPIDGTPDRSGTPVRGETPHCRKVTNHSGTPDCRIGRIVCQIYRCLQALKRLFTCVLGKHDVIVPPIPRKRNV